MTITTKDRVRQLVSTMPEQDTPPGFACPVDRNWIQKLILEHSSNPNHGKGLVVAPMVDQSDLAFRIQCRQYGANVTFTPMIHSMLLTTQPKYQQQFIPTQRHANDRPVIAQLCGHEPDVLEQAAKMVLPYVDAIDLNCGCPQGIAKRGFYGAFLLEEEDILLKCVRRLTSTINKPVTVKVRLLYKEDKSIDAQASMRLYQKLIDAGIHLLTVHGRTRHQLHVHTGAADWSVIRQVVERFGDRIPIFANGNIGSCADVEACFAATGADGVMSSEAVLEYPALFAGDNVRIGRIYLAREYLQLAQQYPPDVGGQGSGVKCLKAHIHRILHPDLEYNGDYRLRKAVAGAETWQTLWDIVDQVERLHQEQEHKVEEEALCWYWRHRITVTDAQGNEMTALQLKHLHDKGLACSPEQAQAQEQVQAEEAPEDRVFWGVNDDGDY